MKSNAMKSQRLSLVPFCCLILISSGCSSVPKPVAEIASASTAISGAQSSGASKYAPVELVRAKTKLELSEKAVKQKNNSKATLLAQEALADANLAKAKSEANKSKKSAAEMEESIYLLRKSLKLDATSNN